MYFKLERTNPVKLYLDRKMLGGADGTWSALIDKH